MIGSELRWLLHSYLKKRKLSDAYGGMFREEEEDEEEAIRCVDEEAFLTSFPFFGKTIIII